MPKAATTPAAGKVDTRTNVLMISAKFDLPENKFAAAKFIHRITDAVEQSQKLIGEALDNPDFEFAADIVVPKRVMGPRKARTPKATPPADPVAAAAAAEAAAKAAAEGNTEGERAAA